MLKIDPKKRANKTSLDPPLIRSPTIRSPTKRSGFDTRSPDKFGLNATFQTMSSPNLHLDNRLKLN